MWCIDFQIVAHLMDEVISSEMVAKYVEGNLEYYIEELTSNSMYKLHIALIKEAYEAYNLGFYKLCVFPLISTFDYVFSLWCEGKIQKNQYQRSFILFNCCSDVKDKAISRKYGDTRK